MSDADTVVTAYGRLDKAALEHAQNSFDTTTVLKMVDELDAMVEAVRDRDGLRERLLRLHAMAHTVINGAGMSVAANRESLPELAGDLVSEIQGMISRLQVCVSQLEPLEELAVHS